MTHVTRVEEVQNAPSVCAVFQQVVREHADRLALRSSDGTVELSWRQYSERVRRIAAGLAALGVGPGDTVAMMLTNRPEFFLVDMATTHLRATPYSMYNSSPATQIEYLLARADCTVVVCEEQFLERTRVATEHRECLIVCVDGDVEGVMSLAQLEAAGDPDFDIDAAARAVRPDDVLTLIFTSGTTGQPKAVELTHRNILYTCGSLYGYPKALGMEVPEAAVVSYLPDAHLADRVFAYYFPVTAGGTIVTVRDGKALAQTLAEVHPTILAAVPMIWYRFKAAIEAAITAHDGETREALEAAIAVGTEVVSLTAAGADVPDDLRARHEQAEHLVLAPLRARLGLDKIVAGISGAAPIAADTLELLMAVGIPVAEGWAMSETSGAGLLNPPNRIKTGTVGIPLPQTEVLIADDGELLVRSPGVMKSYRGEPEKTAEAIDADGWLHTGDVAQIDDDGYVTIIDRKKELIINTAGKTMSPTYIENAVKTASSLVGSVAAIGDRRPYVAALITLDPDTSAAFAAANGITNTSPAALAGEPLIRDAVRAGIEAANGALSRAEAVRSFDILPVYWLPDSDVLTPTMKLKRKVIAEKFAAEIEGLYAHAPASAPERQPAGQTS